MFFVTVTLCVLNILHTQAIPDTCQTSAVPLGLCVLFQDCPVLDPLTSDLSLREFITNYGCGTRDGNVHLCCAIEFSGTKSPVSDARAALRNTGSDTVTEGETIQKNCGKRQVGQGPEWPFVAAIGRYYPTQGGTFQSMGNGVFISQKYVLTTGWLIISSVVTHVIPLSAWVSDQTSTLFKIKHIFLREVTDDGRRSDALGLLLLKETVTFTDLVQAVCLPDPQERDTPSLLHVIGGEKGYSSQIFHKTVMRVPGNSKHCDTSNSLFPFMKLMNIVNMCATGAKICVPSDPLVVDEDNTGRYRIQGLGGISKNTCADDTNQYAYVKPHVTWIETQVKDTSLLSIPTNWENHQCGRQAVGDDQIFPYIVALGHYQNGNFFDIACSGILIHSSWILTEKACILRSRITEAQIMVTGRRVAITETRTYSLYNPLTKEGNIGMLKLEDPLISNEAVCLPSADEMTRNKMVAISLFEKPSFEFSGDQVLGWRIIGAYYDNQCEATRDISDPLKSDSICASGHYVCEERYCSQWILLSRDPDAPIFRVQGIESSTDRSNDSIKIFTRVSSYLQWIKDGL